MTALRLALTELRRVTAGRPPRAALAALVLVPTLYGGLYLYANKDPYGGLDRVPAAFVVEDAGTTLANGERFEVGDRVATELVDSHSFDWHRVSRAAADAGVEDGTYDFALVVPKDFSTDLASSAEFTPEQAQLQVLTNDANNYLARTIANQVVAQVTKSVASQVSSTAANQLLAGFATIHEKVADAVDGADKLANGLADADSGARQLSTGADQLSAGQQKLLAGSKELSAGAAKAATGADDLATGASSLRTGLGTLDDRTSTLPQTPARLPPVRSRLPTGTRRWLQPATTSPTGLPRWPQVPTGSRRQRGRSTRGSTTPRRAAPRSPRARTTSPPATGRWPPAPPGWWRGSRTPSTARRGSAPAPPTCPMGWASSRAVPPSCATGWPRG